MSSPLKWSRSRELTQCWWWQSILSQYYVAISNSVSKYRTRKVHCAMPSCVIYSGVLNCFKLCCALYSTVLYWTNDKWWLQAQFLFVSYTDIIIFICWSPLIFHCMFLNACPFLHHFVTYSPVTSLKCNCFLLPQVGYSPNLLLMVDWRLSRQVRTRVVYFDIHMTDIVGRRHEAHVYVFPWNSAWLRWCNYGNVHYDKAYVTKNFDIESIQTKRNWMSQYKCIVLSHGPRTLESNPTPVPSSQLSSSTHTPAPSRAPSLRPSSFPSAVPSKAPSSYRDRRFDIVVRQVSIAISCCDVLCHTMLCCAVPYRTIPCCAVMCCAVLCFAVVRCAVLCFAVVRCAVMWHIVAYYETLCCIFHTYASFHPLCGSKWFFLFIKFHNSYTSFDLRSRHLYFAMMCVDWIWL